MKKIIKVPYIKPYYWVRNQSFTTGQPLQKSWVDRRMKGLKESHAFMASLLKLLHATTPCAALKAEF